MGKHKSCQNYNVFELINNPLSRDGIVLNESIFRAKYVRAADSERRKLSGLLQMACRNYAEQQLQHELHIGFNPRGEEPATSQRRLYTGRAQPMGDGSGG